MRKSRDKKDSVLSQNRFLKKFKEGIFAPSPPRASIEADVPLSIMKNDLIIHYRGLN